MGQYKNIIVAVDGSEQSYNAVTEAVGVAKRNDTKLTILTVKDINRYYGWASVGTVIETPELDHRAQEILNKAKDIVKNVVACETEELSGDPKHRIVHFAKDNGVDLIIIGSTGVGFIDKLMLGSTTQYVVSHAPCNVMVVK